MVCCHDDFKSSRSSWKGEITKGHNLGQKKIEVMCVLRYLYMKTFSITILSHSLLKNSCFVWPRSNPQESQSMSGQRIRTCTPHRNTKHTWRSGHGISSQHLNKWEEPLSNRKRGNGGGREKVRHKQQWEYTPEPRLLGPPQLSHPWDWRGLRICISDRLPARLALLAPGPYSTTAPQSPV